MRWEPTPHFLPFWSILSKFLGYTWDTKRKDDLNIWPSPPSILLNQPLIYQIYINLPRSLNVNELAQWVLHEKIKTTLYVHHYISPLSGWQPCYPLCFFSWICVIILLTNMSCPSSFVMPSWQDMSASLSYSSNEQISSSASALMLGQCPVKVFNDISWQ